MTIKGKLYSGFALILAVLIIALAVSFYMLAELYSNFQEVVFDRYDKVRRVESVRLDITQLELHMSNLLNADKARGRYELQAMERTRERLRLDLDELSRTVERPEAKYLAAEMKKLQSEGTVIERQIIAMLEADNRGKELAELLLRKTELQERIKRVIDSFVNLQENGMNFAFSQGQDIYDFAKQFIASVGLTGLLVFLVAAAWIIRSILNNLKIFSEALALIKPGLEVWPRIKTIANDEFSSIAQGFNTMSGLLEQDAKHQRELLRLNEEKDWIKTAFAEFSAMYQGVEDLAVLARLFVNKLTPLVGAGCGGIYVKKGKGSECVFGLLASYARAGEYGQAFRLGEGLAGQCAQTQKIILQNTIPAGYIKVRSGLGEAPPRALLLLPVVFEGETLAVIELASLREFMHIELALMEQLAANLGVTLHSITGRERITELLAESQALTEELQSQAEELQNQSEELFHQQEELTSAHEQLAAHYQELGQKNEELESAKAAVEEHARQLAATSQYKSEFLANMSHELRTPLNSILLLASLLADNKTGGLSAKEVEFAKTIHASGSDLLNLIEDILDLSKIESGKMQPDFSCVSLASVLGNMEQHFRPLADAKQIALYIAAADAPETILTDERRLEQILKNLLANAIKFTRQGSVALKVSANDGAVRFAVSDTGIGIAKDQQEIIFESFRQADGKTSRMYGGTGLGLAICRELAGLLNGRIEVESELGAGSTFTLTLPVASGAINEAAAAAGPLLPIISEHAHGEAAADSYLTGKKVLIVDDDMRNVFALTIALEEKKMEVIVAQNGREGLLQLEQHSDIELVLMDIMMPEMDGYEAMRQIRGQGLKLPVIALTAKAMKADRENCIKAGASDYLVKPVQMDQLMSLMRVWLHP